MCNEKTNLGLPSFVARGHIIGANKQFVLWIFIYEDNITRTFFFEKP